MSRYSKKGNTANKYNKDQSNINHYHHIHNSSIPINVNPFQHTGMQLSE